MLPSRIPSSKSSIFICKFRFILLWSTCIDFETLPHYENILIIQLYHIIEIKDFFGDIFLYFFYLQKKTVSQIYAILICRKAKKLQMLIYKVSAEVIPMETKGKIQLLELFGGIGSPRVALKNLGIPVKSIDYVEIDKKAVKSYNAIFANELNYNVQTVVGWNLKPDILIHGSPCQDFSIAGHQGSADASNRINQGRGGDEGSGTRSSLMWETIHIIEQMGKWKPNIVIWENVKNVTSKYMVHNFNKYLACMENLGYTNTFRLLDAREFGLPHARQRVFTVSHLNGEGFNFDWMKKKPMQDINSFLLDNNLVPSIYDVTQPSILAAIGKKGIRRTDIIGDYAKTITCRQDRTPAQVIDCGDGRYRYLTELECWLLQGYSREEYEAAKAVHTKNGGRYYMTLYRQAGNSIPVNIFESMFEAMMKANFF